MIGLIGKATLALILHSSIGPQLTVQPETWMHGTQGVKGLHYDYVFVC